MKTKFEEFIGETFLPKPSEYIIISNEVTEEEEKVNVVSEPEPVEDENVDYEMLVKDSEGTLKMVYHDIKAGDWFYQK